MLLDRPDRPDRPDPGSVFRNVLVRGRCVSVDRRVYSSLRVIPGCYITGQAAGQAAALALENGCDPRAVDVDALRAGLKDLEGRPRGEGFESLARHSRKEDESAGRRPIDASRP